MDFTQFDSRAAAETARPLHLLHPATGVPLYDGDKPCEVLVIGTESRSAQAAIRAAQRAKLKNDKPEARSLEDIHADLVAQAKPLIKGFNNVARGDKTATAEDAEWFLGLNMISGKADERSFVEQVMAFATARVNFLGNGSAA